MGEKTGIGWTDATDNPIRVKNPRAGEPGQPEVKGWWCRKISAECTNCYAETWNGRMGNGMKYIGAPPEMVLDRKMIDGWAKKGKAKRRFVASMTDVFGEWVPSEWIFYMLDGMAAAPKQTFQVLTKWAERMHEEINAWLFSRGRASLPDNIWPGVTAGTQETAAQRLPWLLRIPSKRRWISAEPLLGPMDISEWLSHDCPTCEGYARVQDGSESLCEACNGTGETTAIVWVVVGAESGDRARPWHPQWARDLRDQTHAAGAALFYKQNGEWAPKRMLFPYHRDPVTERTVYEGAEPPANLPWGTVELDGTWHAETTPWNGHDDDGDGGGGAVLIRLGVRRTGDRLDGVTWKEFPDARAA